MCIGLAMRVISCAQGAALCDDRGEARQIDMSLVGDQPPDTWVLVFLDAAREVVSSDHAALVAKALEALALASSGAATSGDLDHLFPDLARREPQLPEHLRKTTV